MRILKVTQAYYPFNERGGPAIKVRSIACALKELGHEVTVLTADLGFGEKQIAAGQVYADPQGWRTDLDGVEVIYFKSRAQASSGFASVGSRNLTLFISMDFTTPSAPWWATIARSSNCPTLSNHWE